MNSRSEQPSGDNAKQGLMIRMSERSAGRGSVCCPHIYVLLRFALCTPHVFTQCLLNIGPDPWCDFQQTGAILSKVRWHITITLEDVIPAAAGQTSCYRAKRASHQKLKMDIKFEFAPLGTAWLVRIYDLLFSLSSSKDFRDCLVGAHFCIFD